MSGSTTELATLGGGCFWCLDAVYRDLRGVSARGLRLCRRPYREPDLRGGLRQAAPAMRKWCRSPSTPPQISYADLLRVFFTIHDPTTQDRQGADVGPQYRSIILTHSPEQAETAKAVMAEIGAAGIWGAPLVTQLEPLERFWAGEAEHQDYFARAPWSRLLPGGHRPESRRNSARPTPTA